MVHGNNYLYCIPPEQCEKWLAEYCFKQNLMYFLSTCLCLPSAGFANYKRTSEKITKTMPRSDWIPATSSFLFVISQLYSSLVVTDKNKQPIIIKLTLVG
jgi:hypothetical protein